eukprot:UN00098
MLTSLFTVSLIALNNARHINYEDCSCTAVATFDGSFGVTGSVTVNQVGEVSVALDTSGVDASICGDGGAEFKYFIHNSWTHSDSDNKYGSQCAGPFTGGHYNPYDKPHCSNVNDVNYWTCELGDLSGRFGNLIPQVDDMVFTQGIVAAPCKNCGARLNPESVAGKSVVFHCVEGPSMAADYSVHRLL